MTIKLTVNNIHILCVLTVLIISESPEMILWSLINYLLSPGEIRTVRVLDREEADFYKLEVEAVDRGVPRLTSTAMVQVTIMDQNDNAPVVVQPLQSVITVKEKQPIGKNSFFFTLENDNRRSSESLWSIHLYHHHI